MTSPPHADAPISETTRISAGRSAVRADVSGLRRQRQTAAGQMAERAAAGAGGRRRVRAVRSVRDVLPFPVPKLFVLCAESTLFPHHEERRQSVRDEAAVLVEQRLA